MRAQHTDWTAIVAGICAMGAAGEAARADGALLSSTQSIDAFAHTTIPVPTLASTALSAPWPSVVAIGSSIKSADNYDTGSIVVTSAVSLASLNGQLGYYFEPSPNGRFTSFHAGQYLQATLAGSVSEAIQSGTMNASAVYDFVVSEATPFSLYFGAVSYRDYGDGVLAPSADGINFQVYLLRELSPGVFDYMDPVVSFWRTDSNVSYTVDQPTFTGDLIAGNFRLEVFSDISVVSGFQASNVIGATSSAYAASIELDLTIPSPGAAVPLAIMVFGVRRRRR